MKSIFALVLSVAFFQALIGQNTVTINGKFTSAPPQTTVTVENFLQPTLFSKTVDVKDNAFSMTFDIDKEDIFKLKLSQQNFLAFIIKPGDKIELVLYPTQLNLNPAIKGSEQSIRLYEAEKIFAKLKISQDSLSTVYQSLGAGDASRQKEIENQYFAFETQKTDYAKSLILGHISSLANMFFIERLPIDQHFEIYAKLDSALFERYNYNPVVANLHKQVESARKTSVGAKASDINFPTPEGELLSLYSVKGKIIIIDFWASWCKPCRAENPNMTKLYADYHSKGLEIFGVSLDKDKAAWIKAIADDKLIWKHVSDLKFWQSEAAALYGVSSIPSMFVLDGDYKIIAKNLRGEQLRTFVASRLN
jgi:thiol-disulfide isomerase/thioredoxin